MNNNTGLRNQQNELGQYKLYQELLKTLEDNHRKSTRRMYIFFVLIFAVFLVVVLLSLIFIDNSFIDELRSGNESLTKNTDYLELVIPILIAIVAAFIAFLGMNRLKDMDSQLDQIRSSINSELEKEVSRVSSLREDLEKHIDVEIIRRTTDFAAKMVARLDDKSLECQNQIENMSTRSEELLSKKIDEFNKIASKNEEDRENFDKQYKWILSDRSIARTALLKDIATVYDIHLSVETLWNSNYSHEKIAELTRRYVEKVTDNNSNLDGDCDDYHNLAAECARHSLYHLSCKICKKGLVFFPNNIDLLADWIHYGTNLGKYDEVKENPLKAILSIDKEQWNWRAFDFTVDYYLSIGKYDDAEKLADDFILFLPYEERAYYCLYEVYKERYSKEEGMEKAINILQSAVDRRLNCPMCANRLAELLCDCGRLEEALIAADYAIQELSQEQPSVNYGYVVYRRALICDRLAYKLCSDDCEIANQYAIKAYTDYQVAIDSKRLSSITQRQANVRCDLLRKYFNINEAQPKLASEELMQLLKYESDNSEP